jgi:hypothetical protein
VTGSLPRAGQHWPGPGPGRTVTRTRDSDDLSLRFARICRRLSGGGLRLASLAAGQTAVARAAGRPPGARGSLVRLGLGSRGRAGTVTLCLRSESGGSVRSPGRFQVQILGDSRAWAGQVRRKLISTIFKPDSEPVTRCLRPGRAPGGRLDAGRAPGLAADSVSAPRRPTLDRDAGGARARAGPGRGPAAPGRAAAATPGPGLGPPTEH